jgi:hypothetical protein
VLDWILLQWNLSPNSHRLCDSWSSYSNFSRPRYWEVDSRCWGRRAPTLARLPGLYTNHSRCSIRESRQVEGSNKGVAVVAVDGDPVSKPLVAVDGVSVSQPLVAADCEVSDSQPLGSSPAAWSRSQAGH